VAPRLLDLRPVCSGKRRRPAIFWSLLRREFQPALRSGLILSALVGLGGCRATAGSPVQPGHAFSVSPELAAAYQLLTTNTTDAEWSGGTVASWVSADRPHLTRIVVGTLSGDVRAQYDHVDTITVSPFVLDQPVEVVAAFIAHEIRHADGIRHDCTDGVRDTAGARGAWYVHLRVLLSYGHAYEADIIRGLKFCG